MSCLSGAETSDTVMLSVHVFCFWISLVSATNKVNYFHAKGTLSISMNHRIPTTVYHDSYNLASNLQYSLSLSAC